MPKQVALTVKQALARVSNDDFVLPGIQRSFVWQQKQIIRLFDSLLRGYPIGSFLVWQTTKADNPGHRFYRLHTNFRGGGGHGSEVRLPPRATVMALLDGQQRMTALNIGRKRGCVRDRCAADPLPEP